MKYLGEDVTEGEVSKKKKKKKEEGEVSFSKINGNLSPQFKKKKTVLQKFLGLILVFSFCNI